MLIAIHLKGTSFCSVLLREMPCPTNFSVSALLAREPCKGKGKRVLSRLDRIFATLTGKTKPLYCGRTEERERNGRKGKGGQMKSYLCPLPHKKVFFTCNSLS